jgi:hypothetical protein
MIFLNQFPIHSHFLSYLSFILESIIDPVHSSIQGALKFQQFCLLSYPCAAIDQHNGCQSSQCPFWIDFVEKSAGNMLLFAPLPPICTTADRRW